MSDDPLSTDRQARDSALARLTGHYDRLRTGLRERPVGQRVVEEAMGKARQAGKEALEIANDSKGVIAATAGALAIWAFRKPLSRAVQGLWPRIKAWRGKESDSE